MSELTNLSQLPKANILRYLVALEQSGFIKQNPITKKYCLGSRFLELAYLVNKQINLRDLVLPYMEHLLEATNETVCLFIEEDGEGVCIERLEPNEELVCLPPVGRKEPIYAGASRKILLAFLDDQRIKQIIEEKGLSGITKNTVIDKNQLRKEIELIRKQGYAISGGEHIEGICSIAAPIKGSEGNVVASLSIVAPLFRMDREKEISFLTCLLKTTRNISNDLGYQNYRNNNAPDFKD